MFGLAGRGVPFAEGYLKIKLGIFDPANYFPDLYTYEP
jgi:hypothetical protein